MASLLEATRSAITAGGDTAPTSAIFVCNDLDLLGAIDDSRSTPLLSTVAACQAFPRTARVVWQSTWDPCHFPFSVTGHSAPTPVPQSRDQHAYLAASLHLLLARTSTLRRLDDQLFLLWQATWEQGIEMPLPFLPQLTQTMMILPASSSLPLAPDKASGPKPHEIAGMLCAWLTLTHADIARITGISRASFFKWKRPGMTPRPATLRPLLRIYALVRAVIEHRGEHDATAWFHTGNPSPLTRLLQNDITGVEDAVANLLFRAEPERQPSDAAFALEDDFEVSPLPQAMPPRLAARRPQSLKLPQQ